MAAFIARLRKILPSFDVIARWLFSGAVKRGSLFAFLEGPLVLFILTTVPFPWDARYSDSRWMGAAILIAAGLLLVVVMALALTAPDLAPPGGHSLPTPPKMKPTSKRLAVTALGLASLLA